MESLLQTGMRGYLMDCHRNDLQEISFEGFEPKKVRALLRSSHVDNLMLYAKDHWGYSYYPGEVGPVHPKLKEIGLDFLGEVMAIAEEEGISVCVYYSIDTDHWCGKTHPEWRVLNPDGKPVKAGGWYRCGISHQYGDYALAQIEEILKKYHPKGMFFDCFPSVLCFCEECQKQYAVSTGRKMPLGNLKNDNWRELHRYEEEHYWLPFARKLRNLFDKISPGTTLTTNGCNANMPKSIRDLYDYHFAEPWAGNYLSAGFVRDIMKNPQVGPGNVGMVYDSTPPEYVLHELLSIGMQGARPFLYSESLRHDGAMEEHEWVRIGKAYQEIKKVQRFWTGSVLADIQILYSEQSHLFALDRKNYNQSWWERTSNHLKNIQALMSIATGMHRGYEIIEGDSPNLLESLNKNAVVLVSNAMVMPESSWKKLTEFVQGGGKVLLSLCELPVSVDGCMIRLDKIEELTGCRIKGVDRRFLSNVISSYLQVGSDSPLPEPLKKHPLGLSGTRLMVEPNGADVLASFLSPAIEVDFGNEQWMAWRPPNPGNDSTGPAILCHELGQGMVYFFAFDVISMASGSLPMETAFAIQASQQWHWPKILLVDVINALSTSKISLEGLSDRVKVSYFKSQDKVYIHLLTGVGDQIEANRGRIRWNSKFLGIPAKAKAVYPETSNLTITQIGSVACIHLPQIAHYQVIEVLTE